MDIVYGIQALPKHDPYIDAAEEAMISLSGAGNPGNFLGRFIILLHDCLLLIVTLAVDTFPASEFKDHVQYLLSILKAISATSPILVSGGVLQTTRQRVAEAYNCYDRSSL